MHLRTKNFFSLLKKNNGFTLIEILITTALTTIVIVGLGALFSNISKLQAQVKIQVSLEQVAFRLRSAIVDQKGWNNTVNISLAGAQNLGFQCAAQKMATCAPTPFSATPLADYPTFDTIQDNSSAGPYGASLYLDNGTNGYTYQGAPCVGFSMASSTPDCPFSYRLRYQFACPSSTSCLNPQVTIFGFLQQSQDPNVAHINVDRFQIHIIKGMNTPHNDLIQIVEQNPGGAGPISNTSGGQLCSNVPIARTFNAVLIDSACNGVAASASCNVVGPPTALAPSATITLVGGTYVCYATAQGYAVDGFSIAVSKDGVQVPGAVSPQAFADSATGGIETAAIPNFTVSNSSNFTLQLTQQCSSTGTAPYALGLPLGGAIAYVNSVFSGIYCTRLL